MERNEPQARCGVVGLVGEPYNFMSLSPEPTAMIFPVEESDTHKVGGGMTYEEKNPQSVT